MARISEIHYSNAYAASSGVSEFLEVALASDEDPADFSVVLYNADGTSGLTVPLDDAGVVVTYDTDSGEYVYVISSDNYNFLLTDPDGGGSTNYEAMALVNTQTNTVIDFYDVGGGTQDITAVDGLAQGATSENLPVLEVPNQTTTTIQFNQPDPDTLVYEDVSSGDTGVICFVAGTMIRTPRGEVPVESLRPGDLVDTQDNGAQPVRWSGSREVPGRGHLAPVVIGSGVLGNDRPLLVSPQHRVLLQNAASSVYFGLDGVLSAAVHLVDGKRIRREPCATVSYHHLMFDAHELVWANGALAESLFVGRDAVNAMPPDMLDELRAIFPELLDTDTPGFGVTARPVLRRFETRLLVEAT